MKPCPMVPADDLSIGVWDDIQQPEIQKKMQSYLSLKAPGEDVCKNCKYFAYCYNCFVRGLKAGRQNPYCKWMETNKEIIMEIRV